MLTMMLSFARRRALAEALRQGEPVVVSPTGEVGTKEEMQDNGLSGIPGS